MPASPSGLGAAFADIARAAAALGQAAAALPAAAERQPTPRIPPGPLAWRVAFQAIIASALAMAGGMALSPQRWFWAAITAYLVFLGTRSSGETAYKGAQRVAGTLLGLVAGVTLAAMLHGNGPAQEVAVLAAIFGMYYLFFASYSAGIFCVMVLLGLIYSLLGSSMEPILVLRLEETAIGAAAAAFVAVCVLPLHTTGRVAQSGTAVLRVLADAAGACRRALAGEPDATPVPAMRVVDRQVADLRLALLPLTVGRVLLRRTELERPMPALLSCVHRIRVLSLAVTAPDHAAAVRLTSIEQCLRGLAAGSLMNPADCMAGEAAAADGNAVSLALDELDAALSALVERLAIGALHGSQPKG